MTAPRGGKIAAKPKGQAQHVDLYRKLQLRRQLITTLGDAAQGGIYVPFCGDGDIAVELDYASRFSSILAVDTNPDRTATFWRRIPKAIVALADADAAFPFADLTPAQRAIVRDPILVAGDFDAYVEPYTAFRLAWESAAWGDRVALFFTDGHRQGIKRTGTYLYPDGRIVRDLSLPARRKLYHALFATVLRPWLAELVAARGYRIVRTFSYLRMDMVYWGAVIDRPAH